MSWLFSQALVAAYSEASCSDGEQSAPSNTTPTPQAFLWRDKTTDAWNRFPSGMTCEPLTDDRGEGLLKLFLEGFLALTSVPPSKTRKASRGSKADCGLRWPALLAKWDRDTSSWKTAQCLLLAGLDEFSETWPKWGMMRDGECWELAMPALHTTESASGSWVTPNARDWKDSPNMATVRKDGKNKVDQTPRQVFQFWRSPQARDWKNASTIAERGGHTLNAPDQALAHFGGRGERQSPKPETTARSASYNPEFAEWLMAWPIGWTDLKPLETGRWDAWLHSHGVSSADPDSTQPHTPA